MYYQKMNLPKRFNSNTNTIKKKKVSTKLASLSEVVNTEEMEKIE